MIKKVIFDIDMTLLDTKRDCITAYNKFLEKNGFKVTGLELWDKLDEMNYNDATTLDHMYDFLHNYLGNTLTKEMYKEFLDFNKMEATHLFEDTIDVLEYLKGKYELIVLSNWFYEVQISKLKTAGIDKYFDKVYTIDTFGKKPLVETFQRACYPYSLEECAMIGDSLSCDIKVPHEIGMKAIYVGAEEGYLCIKDIKELYNIL